MNNSGGYQTPGLTQQQKFIWQETHTFKNQITVLPDGQDIVDVIAVPGPKVT